MSFKKWQKIISIFFLQFWLPILASKFGFQPFLKFCPIFKHSNIQTFKHSSQCPSQSICSKHLLQPIAKLLINIQTADEKAQQPSHAFNVNDQLRKQQ